MRKLTHYYCGKPEDVSKQVKHDLIQEQKEKKADKIIKNLLRRNK